MAIDWAMAAVVASLAIFAAPMAWKGVVALVSNLRRDTTCRVLNFKWDDIPCGLVHDCPQRLWRSSCQNCPATLARSTQEQSSTSFIIVAVFNRAWDRFRASPRFVHRPHGLSDSSAIFICTQACVVLALALMADETAKWSPLVRFEKIQDVIICHTKKGGHEPFRSTLTKSELQCLLEGYPPWYRETFTTRWKFVLPFPIADDRDITRGGWVVAVGLMRPDIVGQEPLKRYRCHREPVNPGHRQNGVAFRMAIRRCLNHIDLNIRPHFVHDLRVRTAIAALKYLVDERTGSGMPWGAFPKPGSTLPAMSASDCRFLMRHFNEFSDLMDPEDVARYSRMIGPAMVVVVWGAYEIVEYLKDVGRELLWPEFIADLGQEVYLKIDE